MCLAPETVWLGRFLRQVDAVPCDWAGGRRRPANVSGGRRTRLRQFFLDNWEWLITVGILSAIADIKALVELWRTIVGKYMPVRLFVLHATRSSLPSGHMQTMQITTRVNATGEVINSETIEKPTGISQMTFEIRISNATSKISISKFAFNPKQWPIEDAAHWSSTSQPVPGPVDDFFARARGDVSSEIVLEPRQDITLNVWVVGPLEATYSHLVVYGSLWPWGIKIELPPTSNDIPFEVRLAAAPRHKCELTMRDHMHPR